MYFKSKSSPIVNFCRTCIVFHGGFTVIHLSNSTKFPFSSTLSASAIILSFWKQWFDSNVSAISLWLWFAFRITQQFQFLPPSRKWNSNSKEIYMPWHSQWRYLPWSKYGNNPSVCQQCSGKDVKHTHVLLNHKREWHLAIYDHMGEPGGYYA